MWCIEWRHQPVGYRTCGVYYRVFHHNNRRRLCAAIYWLFGPDHKMALKSKEEAQDGLSLRRYRTFSVQESWASKSLPPTPLTSFGVACHKPTSVFFLQSESVRFIFGPGDSKYPLVSHDKQGTFVKTNSFGDKESGSVTVLKYTYSICMNCITYIHIFYTFCRAWHFMLRCIWVPSLMQSFFSPEQQLGIIFSKISAQLICKSNCALLPVTHVMWRRLQLRRAAGTRAHTNPWSCLPEARRLWGCRQ